MTKKKSFEKKFAHDEELKFKVASRRNKYLGQWASKKLGYDENKEKEYIQSVIKLTSKRLEMRMYLEKFSRFKRS